MTLSAPVLVRSAPELASIDILAGVLEATIVALIASHPCLEIECRCVRPLAPCTLAVAILEHIYQLDNAIIHYRAVVEVELEAERRGEPPF